MQHLMLRSLLCIVMIRSHVTLVPFLHQHQPSNSFPEAKAMAAAWPARYLFHELHAPREWSALSALAHSNWSALLERGELLIMPAAIPCEHPALQAQRRVAAQRKKKLAEDAKAKEQEASILGLCMSRGLASMCVSRSLPLMYARRRFPSSGCTCWMQYRRGCLRCQY